MPSVALRARNGSSDIVGKTFWDWFVIAEQGKIGRDVAVLCQCKCGDKKLVKATTLRRGKTKSCGCNRRTGASSRPEYRIWNQMRQRCTNPKNKRFYRYGGRGIVVCESWRSSFDNFFRDMGPRPSDEHSIDRIDNNGNYERKNCRWADSHTQHRNKGSNRSVTINGATHCVADWCKILGVPAQRVRGRIRTGWCEEDAILMPLIPRGNRKNSAYRYQPA